jgi:hypothetical protein
MSTRHLLRVKGGRRLRFTSPPSMRQPFGKCGSLDVSQPYGPPCSVAGMALLYMKLYYTLDVKFNWGSYSLRSSSRTEWNSNFIDGLCDLDTETERLRKRPAHCARFRRLIRRESVFHVKFPRNVHGDHCSRHIVGVVAADGEHWETAVCMGILTLTRTALVSYENVSLLLNRNNTIHR